MMRRAFALFLVVAISVGSFGCASKEKPPEQESSFVSPVQKPPKPFFLYTWMNAVSKLIPKKKKPPAAVPPQWAGTIRMVNASERFVLIESNTLSSIVPGANYISVAQGTETATLLMTPLRNPPFLIADIVSGTPAEGEKIYLPRASQPDPSPSPAPSPDPSPKPAPEPIPDPLTVDPPLPGTPANPRVRVVLPAPAPEPESSPAPAASPTPKPTASPKPTATPKPKPTPKPKATPKPKPSPGPAAPQRQR